MGWSICDYTMSRKTRDAIEDSIRISFDEAMMLDFDKEIELVESITGHKPRFSENLPHSLTPRGNVALSQGHQTLPNHLEDGLREMDLAYGV